MPTQKPCFFLLNGEHVLIEPMGSDSCRAGSLPCMGVECVLTDKWRMPHCHEYHSSCEFCSCDGNGVDLSLSYMMALDRMELVPDLQREVAEGLICKNCSGYVVNSDDDIVVHNNMRKQCVYGRCIEVLEDWKTPTWEEEEGESDERVTSLYSIAWCCIAEGVDGFKNGLCLYDPLFIVCSGCYDVLHYAKRSIVGRNIDNVFLTKGRNRKEVVRNIRKIMPDLRLKMEIKNENKNENVRCV